MQGHTPLGQSSLIALLSSGATAGGWRQYGMTTTAWHPTAASGRSCESRRAGPGRPAGRRADLGGGSYTDLRLQRLPKVTDVSPCSMQHKV